MKRILVTGANKGIGFAIVEGLLKRYSDTFIYLACRNLEKAASTSKTFYEINISYAARVEPVVMDVSCDNSVSSVAESLKVKMKAEGRSLYGIVNNAGIFSSASGPREVINVNLNGVKRVFDNFACALQVPDARVVNIASASGPNYLASCDTETHKILTGKNVTWDEIATLCARFLRSYDNLTSSEQQQSASKSYGFSKACVNALTRIQARANRSLKINSCTPGFIETDLTRPFAENQGKTPMEMGMKKPKEGIYSTLFLLMEQDLLSSGHYFGSDCKRSPLDRYRAPGDPPFQDK